MMAQRLESLRLEQFREEQWRRSKVFLASVAGVLLCAVILFIAIQSHGFRNVSTFLIVGCITLPSALLILRRLREMRIQSHVAIVKGERERLARELHDTVIQDCTGVSVLLEAIAGALERDEPIPKDLLNCAREQARRTVDDARNAICNLRRPEKGTDLVAALQNLAAQMTANGKTSVSVRHNVTCLAVPASSANEISMTVREAICNAARHSGTEKILVDLCSDTQGLRVSIQDYGCGLLAAVSPSDSKQFGITGMQERMRRLGGNLQIDGMPGAGTTVNLMLRWGSMRKSMVWI
jgi:signal transduction histidine kinase